jgi:hypothetical protein
MARPTTLVLEPPHHGMWFSDETQFNQLIRFPEIRLAPVHPLLKGYQLWYGPRMFPRDGHINYWALPFVNPRWDKAIYGPAVLYHPKGLSYDRLHKLYDGADQRPPTPSIRLFVNGYTLHLDQAWYDWEVAVQQATPPPRILPFVSKYYKPTPLFDD